MAEEFDEIAMELTPPDISNIAKEITLDLLPRKSRELYEKKYEEFMKWRSEKRVHKISENVLLAYFGQKAKVMKSSSLWSTYSMLKATIKLKNDIDIKTFYKLTAFLKRESVGYKPKKSKTLSHHNISKFLLEAHDSEFLMKKVVLIFGIAGACRRDELVKMTTEDIQVNVSVIIVTITDSKSNKGRMFTITNDNNSRPNVDYLAICKKYLNLRPKNPTSNRLFLKYDKGVCTNMVVGMNTIAKIPKDVANYLGLPEPEEYTGHCFRRTSATLLVSGGGDITQLKRHGGWKSSAVAEGYIDDNLQNKNATAHKILGNQNPTTITSESEKVDLTLKSDEIKSIGSGLIIQNCKKCTFNININNTH